jgi:uncharacterized protein
MRLIAVIVAGLVLCVCGVAVAHPAATTTPADCAGPVSAVKQLICNDPHLADVNHRIKAAYHRALARPGADRTALRTVRKDWKTARDGCAYNTDVHTCVLEAYQPAGFGPLTAQFYNQLVPPVTVLNWKGDDQLLFVRPADFGARYGSEYSRHQGGAKLYFNGAEFICRTS